MALKPGQEPQRDGLLLRQSFVAQLLDHGEQSRQPLPRGLTGGSVTLIVVTAAMTALAIYKHKSNIQRLLSGTESRFGSRNKEATS